MSIAADLLMAEIAAAEGADGVGYLSWSGDGAALLSHLAAPLMRIGLRQEPRLFAADGVVAAEPPLSAEIAGRDRAPPYLIVDAAIEEAEVLLTASRTVKAAGADLFRLRGEGPPPPGIARLLLLPGASTEDRIFLRDPPKPAIEDRATALMLGRVDEFDALGPAISSSGSAKRVRFVADGAEILLKPLTTALRPDQRQLRRALSEGRLGFDALGLCDLSIPLFSAAPVGVGVVVEGLAADAPDPVADAPTDWSARMRRKGTRWSVEARPKSGLAAVTAHLEIAASAPGGAWIDEVWTTAQRLRAPWEDWDEAEARLALEESW